MEQQSNNGSLVFTPHHSLVRSVTHIIEIAAKALRDKELYREDVEIITAALRELQEAVIQGTELGARAALLKPYGGRPA